MLAGLEGQGGSGGVFVRLGETAAADGKAQGDWVEMPMPRGNYRLGSFRAFALYKDPVTGLDRIFAGTGPQMEGHQA
jgi:hypothetical protein